MDELAQLDGLTNRLTITCPQLDAIHRAPPHWIRIAWGQGRLGLRHSRNSLSTFPQRSEDHTIIIEKIQSILASQECGCRKSSNILDTDNKEMYPLTARRLGNGRRTVYGPLLEEMDG